MNFINRVAGNGKTAKLICDVNNLLSNGTDRKKICIISLNNKHKSIDLNKSLNQQISILSFDLFINQILKETGLFYQQIDDLGAISLISSLLKKHSLSSDNLSIKKLYKATSFARELYNLFGILKTNNIQVATLEEISKNLNSNDKVRFQDIIKIFSEYNDILKKEKLLDYRDIILTCLQEYKKHKFLQNIIKENYEYIFVIGAENLSAIQLEFIKNIIEDDKIFLYGDFNSKINTFKGENVFDVPPSKFENDSFRNKDILQRALFMKNANTEYSFEKTNSIEYKIFTDISEEIKDIAKEIIEDIKNNRYKYSDFAILIRDNLIKKTIAEQLLKYNIPINNILYSDDFENFKKDISQILTMFDRLREIGIKSIQTKIIQDQNNEIIEDKVFNLQNITEYNELSVYSTVDLQETVQEINILTENIFAEIFTNKYTFKSIISENTANKKDLLLYNIVHSPKDNIDKIAVNKKIDFLKNLYNNFYINNDFINLISIIADITKSQDNNYHKFIATLLKKISIVSKIKSLFSDNLNFEDINKLLNITLEEKNTDENNVHLLTIFKSAGMEFKKVWIPSLTENYFPKQIKTIQYISEESNKYISEKLNLKNNIIISAEDERKDENTLLYIAMTRAIDKLTLSTHTFENKQQTVASEYFERLYTYDNKNIKIQKNERNKKNNLETQHIKTEIADTKEETQSPIIGEDTLYLTYTSIGNFLQCPKKYYYKDILKLKEDTSFSATYGIAVHAVFKVALEKYISDFNSKRLIYLGNILFSIKENEINIQKALNEGFDTEIVELLNSLDFLNIEEMHKDFDNAILELNKKDYFNKKPISADCEVEFKNLSISGIDNVFFSGKIDAIIKYETGETLLVDYKTGSEFLSKNIMEALIKPNNQYYQLPIYYFATKNYERIKEKYNHKQLKIGYQFIRPEYLKGFSESIIEAELFGNENDKDSNINKIINNLKENVIDKIRNNTTFAAVENNFTCRNCGFCRYCDKKNTEDEE
jgi:DNA helicase-2/ATP-dependent DNA helicase PcrA